MEVRIGNVIINVDKRLDKKRRRYIYLMTEYIDKMIEEKKQWENPEIDEWMEYTEAWVKEKYL